MPTYVYQRQDGTLIEIEQSIREDPLTAAERWPGYWAGCDAAGAGADIPARLNAATDSTRRRSGAEMPAVRAS